MTSSKKKGMIDTVFLSFMVHLASRNNMIFKQKTADYDTIFFLIIIRLCLWLKAIDSYFPYSASNISKSANGLLI